MRLFDGGELSNLPAGADGAYQQYKIPVRSFRIIYLPVISVESSYFFNTPRGRL